MALPDTRKLVLGTPLVFSNSGEYSPSGGDQPTGTDADIDLQGVANGAIRQSAKLDLGSANLDTLWLMAAYIEWFSAPTAGGAVNFHLGFSGSATAGNDNPGGLSGTDAVYQGYGADAASGLEAIKQLTYVGSLIATADAAVQVQRRVGFFIPENRYVCLAVHNDTSVNLANTDAIETAVVIYPIQDQIQD